ncbi:MAG: ABC transporter substrate-binding protein [Clostridiaceae bacterium]|nr:ABC transporter substrate-binding protein [Clostridiaceae bacterium]
MKKNIMRLVSLIMALVMMLSLVACGDNSEKTEGGETEKSETQTPTGEIVSAKDTFKLGMSAEPTSMDPAQSKDLVTWMFMLQTYDTLIKYDWEKQQYVPALASEWKVNADSTEVEFTIREDITFHNGEKMTMDDVIFSLERALNSTFTAQINGSIDHFEKIDETHLKVVLKYGYAPILEVLVTPCWGIVSKKAVEECEAKGEDFGRIACGTGAYKLKEWKSGEKLVFEAFDNYYGGKPYVQNIEAMLIADQSSGAIALENGTLDYYYGVQSSDIAHLKDVPSLKVYTIDTGVGLYDITFNVNEGIFSDVKLRQAVAYALDRDEILLGGQEGNGVVNDCFCATAAFGYLPDFKWYEQDLDKAKELMTEAGYPNGFDVVFTQDSSKTYMTSAEIMQAQLKKVGINVTFEKLERATWLDTVASNRQFLASLRMTNHVVNDADYILTRRLTSSMIGGGNNYSGYSNPEFDALVEKARTSSNEQERLDLYRQCYEMIKEDVPAIPLYTTNSQQVVSAKLQGWIAHPMNRNPWCNIWFEK